MLSRGRGLWGRLLVVALGATLLPVLSASPAQAEVPSVPQDVRAEQISVDEVEVRFDPPEDDGGSEITGYEGICLWGSDEEDSITTTGESSPIVVTLPDDLGASRITCGAAAINEAGTGQGRGEKVLVARALTAPSIPEMTTYGDRAHFTFVVPEGGAGRPTIECTSRDGFTVSGSLWGTVTNPDEPEIEFEFSVSPLSAGEHYRCRGRLEHELPSAWSEPTDEFEHVRDPDAPIIEHVSRISPRAVRLTVAPGEDGGRPITRFYASCVPQGDVDYVKTVFADAANSPLTVRGLVPGQRYECQVLAENEIGRSAYSDAEMVAMPPAAPPATYRFNASWNGLGFWGVRYATSADIYFQIRLTNGRKVWRTRAKCVSTDGGAKAVTTTFHKGGLRPYDFGDFSARDLTRNKKYKCKLRHKNAIGWGPWSDWKRVKPDPWRPEAPAGVKAKRKKPRVAKVRFEAGRVHYRKVTKSRTKCVSPRGVTVKEVNRHRSGLRKGDVARVWIQGLSKRRAYRCKVKLRNSQGWGDWSDKVRVRRR